MNAILQFAKHSHHNGIIGRKIRSIGSNKFETLLLRMSAQKRRDLKMLNNQNKNVIINIIAQIREND